MLSFFNKNAWFALPRDELRQSLCTIQFLGLCNKCSIFHFHLLVCKVLDASSLGPHRASCPTKTSDLWILFSGQEMEGLRQRSSGICHLKLRSRIRTQAFGFWTWNPSILQASGDKFLQRPSDLQLECSWSSVGFRSPLCYPLWAWWLARRSATDSQSLSPALCLRLSNMNWWCVPLW